MDIKFFLKKPIAAQSLLGILILVFIWQLYTGLFQILYIEQKINYQHEPFKDLLTVKKTFEIGLKKPFFGEYVPANLEAGGVKKSMLDLHVTGIMFANDEKNSHVIIKTAGGKEHMFRIGDSIGDGIIIKRITSEGVLITRDGEIESLSLPKKPVVFQPPAKELENSD